ncbi:MAG: GNAT family N-acetyltransferase [Bacilli bacterium]|nr:GNAT family N-acetyltransferase [Bacilli bacterium]
MKLDFRIANENDVEAIIKLCNECFEEETSLDYAKKVFNETKDDKNQIYLIGSVDGEVIAHTKITIIPTIYEKMNKYAILNHVCVRPDYRRHNLATQMLEECNRICKDNGCVAMELWSMNFREAAHACYKNFGFHVDDAKFFSIGVK